MLISSAAAGQPAPAPPDAAPQAGTTSSPAPAPPVPPAATPPPAASPPPATSGSWLQVNPEVRLGSVVLRPQIGIGAWVQPQLRWVSLDPSLDRADGGFVLRHVRPFLAATLPLGAVELFLKIEADVTPQFSLFDAFIGGRGALPGGGFWRLALGQMQAPFSRQMMVYPAELQFADRAAMGDLAPGQQLGALLNVRVPYARWIDLYAAVYNGEGRNVIQNVDTHFMYVGRLAVRPFAPAERQIESALGPTTLSIAGNVAYNVLEQGPAREARLLAAGDVFVSWQGISFYGEFLYGKSTYSMAAAKPDFQSFGINVQGGYLLPIPGVLYRRFEIAGRFEEVLRNDTVPLAAPGDPNQAQQRYVVGLNYFHGDHRIKAQLNYIHTFYRDDPNRNGRPIHNDAIVLQITLRAE